MTWVKFGEYRVNTDHVVSYWPDWAVNVDGRQRLRVLLLGGDEPSFYSDPDGALLKLLDDACFPHEHEWMSTDEQPLLATCIHCGAITDTGQCDPDPALFSVHYP